MKLRCTWVPRPALTYTVRNANVSSERQVNYVDTNSFIREKNPTSVLCVKPAFDWKMFSPDTSKHINLIIVERSLSVPSVVRNMGENTPLIAMFALIRVSSHTSVFFVDVPFFESLHWYSTQRKYVIKRLLRKNLVLRIRKEREII